MCLGHPAHRQPAPMRAGTRVTWRDLTRGSGSRRRREPRHQRTCSSSQSNSRSPRIPVAAGSQCPVGALGRGEGDQLLEEGAHHGFLSVRWCGAFAPPTGISPRPGPEVQVGGNTGPHLSRARGDRGHAYPGGDRRSRPGGADAVAPAAPAGGGVGGDRRPDPRVDRADDQGGDPGAGHGGPAAPDRGRRPDDARRVRPPRHQPGVRGRAAPDQPHRALRRPVGDGLRPARGAHRPDRQAARRRRRRPVRRHRHGGRRDRDRAADDQVHPRGPPGERWSATS